MGQLSNISGGEAVRAFAKLGWKERGRVGSHVVMTKENQRANLSIPQHKELAPGTLRALIRNAGITVEEFLTHL